MRISGNPGTEPAAAARAADAPRPDAASATAPAALASGVMQPAMDALRGMSDVDTARVAEIREALARGEIRFDAGKLASLITRYHGSRP
ncbi:MAG: flagellar biosynthesis anti-sigma factor FlgM [Hydrogenophaga sp.]|uniref:flagellar biosynthesis anti-sigma factor FlgM n=1 Tax=Hydrogenophaga sp. TaxID=1904254 RepID=UPI004035F408